MQVRLSSVIRGPCVNMSIWNDATFVNPAKTKGARLPRMFGFEKKTSNRRTWFVLQQHWLHSLVGLSSLTKQTDIKAAPMFKTLLVLCIFSLQLREPKAQRGQRGRRGEPGRAAAALLAPVRSAIPHTSTAKWDDDLRQPEQEAAGERRRREEASRTGEWNKYTEARRQGSLNEMWKRKQDERGKKVKYTELMEAGGRVIEGWTRPLMGRDTLGGKCAGFYTPDT